MSAAVPTIAMPSPGVVRSHHSIDTPLRYGLLLLALRLLMLVALWLLTGGHELSNDTSMHMGMVRHPLSVLLGTYPEYQQNPPLLPFLETTIGYPLQLYLPDFVSLRVVMIVYEALLGALFCQLLIVLRLGDRQRHLCLIGYLLLPMGWMTSVVMAQDEVIAATAFLLPLLLLATGRERGAILACGIGVIAGKLFIGLELLTLIALSSRRRLARNIAIGFAPIFIVYGLMTLHRLQHGLPLPLLGFRPDPIYGTTFWMLLRNHAGVSLRAVGPYSGLLALGASLVPAAVVLGRRGRGTVRPVDALTIALAANTSLLLFFSLFYHVNPEYFIMTLPLLLATARDGIDAAGGVLVSIIPWAGKFFQNAQFMAQAGTNTGKVVAMKYYALVFHSPPEYWLFACQLMFSVVIMSLSIRCCLRLSRG